MVSWSTFAMHWLRNCKEFQLDKTTTHTTITAFRTIAKMHSSKIDEWLQLKILTIPGRLSWSNTKLYNRHADSTANYPNHMFTIQSRPFLFHGQEHAMGSVAFEAPHIDYGTPFRIQYKHLITLLVLKFLSKRIYVNAM